MAVRGQRWLKHVVRLSWLWLVACLLLGLTACCSKPPPLPPEPPPISDDDGESPRGFPLDVTGKYYTVDVYYGTNRRNTGQGEAGEQYQREFSSKIDYGVAQVSIPLRHSIGKLESKSFLRLEFKSTPDRHLMVMGVTELERTAYLASLRQRVAESESRECFIFVHGFNVSWDEAARRTAQMAYDMEYTGAPIFFSWPSQHKLSVGGYKADRKYADKSVPMLRAFIEDTARQSGAERVNIIAHSMGSRLLVQALESLADDAANDPTMPIINEIILAAPDVDTRVFVETIAPEMARVSRGVTVYASNHDRALTISNCLNAVPILGNSKDGLAVSDLFHTIDASGADTNPLGIGHSYYGEVPVMLRDIGGILRGLSPERRGLQETSGDSGRYWTLMKRRAAAAESSGTDEVSLAAPAY